MCSLAKKFGNPEVDSIGTNHWLAMGEAKELSRVHRAQGMNRGNRILSHC